MTVFRWLCVLCLCSSHAYSEEAERPANNEVVALDVNSGEERWVFTPQSLATARFSVFENGAVVVDVNPGKSNSSVVLDASSGKRGAKPSGKLVSRSEVLGDAAAGSWRIVGYSRKQQGLVLRNRQLNSDWSVRTPRPKDTLLTESHLMVLGKSDLRCFPVGNAKTAWSIDLKSEFAATYDRVGNSVGSGRLRIESEHVIVQDGPLLCSVEIASGRVSWKIDVAAELDVPFLGGIMGRNSGDAAFAFEGSRVIVAYERCILALDTGPRPRILWYLKPRSYPHRCAPVIVHDSVIVIAGPKRALRKPAR